MGILNVTPDSFSDGGNFVSLDAALHHAEEMISQGAVILDVGGESTRPNASAVPLQQELDRVIPVIEAIRSRFSVSISIDTSKPEVMRAAVAVGASLINDVCALRVDGALEAAAALNVPVCLMHMQGEPRTMQRHPYYEDVVAEVKTFLAERIDRCLEAGMNKQNIWVDPGFGFGKTLQHNLDLLRQLHEFVDMGVPVLVGLSRKSMIGQIVDEPVEGRVMGSVAAALIAAQQGASVIRVHDVKETAQALKVLAAVQQVNS